MKRRVVDSNVPIVANGGVAVTASIQCRLKAVEALNDIINSGKIIVDVGGEIIGEYKRYLNSKGQPGVGDRFFQQVLMDYSGKIERIELIAHPERVFEDFPEDPDLENFDISDRKFAAAAKKSDSPILNATDSDWLEHLNALDRNGISVEFVCGLTLGKPTA